MAFNVVEDIGINLCFRPFPVTSTILASILMSPNFIPANSSRRIPVSIKVNIIALFLNPSEPMQALMIAFNPPSVKAGLMISGGFGGLNVSGLSRI